MRRTIPTAAILAAGLAVLALFPLPARASPRRIVVGGRAVALVANAVYLFPTVHERVVAVAAADQGLGVFLGALDPGHSRKPAIDRNAGVETYASLAPDLVVLKSSMKPALEQGLGRLGIPRIYLELEQPEDYYRELATLGATLGEPERGAALAAYFKAAADGVTARTSLVPEARQPRVLVLQASIRQGGTFEVPPAEWMQTRIVRMAGGSPVWTRANPGSGWAVVGPEQILAWDPDFVFVVSYREDASAVARAFSADRRFSGLKAVARGGVAGFPQDFNSWDQPDTRWILGLQWAARRLHPSLFAGDPLGPRIRDFFLFCYGLDAARFDILVAPRLAGDHAD